MLKNFLIPEEFSNKLEEDEYNELIKKLIIAYPIDVCTEEEKNEFNRKLKEKHLLEQKINIENNLKRNLGPYGGW